MTETGLGVFDFDPYSALPIKFVACDSVDGALVRRRVLQARVDDVGPLMLDAWERARMEMPIPLKELTFQYKVFDGEVWNDGPTYEPASSSVVVHTTDSGEGTATFFESQEYIRSDPHLSTVVLIGFWLQNLAPNVDMQVGPHDESNGFFLQQLGVSDVAFVHRIGGIDIRYVQALWNIDSLDGTGPSGKVIDLTKLQIMVIDLCWFGATRLGFMIDGVLQWAHVVDRTNSYASYGRTITLPVRMHMNNVAQSDAAHQIRHLFGAVYQEAMALPQRPELFSAAAGPTSVLSSYTPLLAVRASPLFNGATNRAAIRFRSWEVFTTGGDIYAALFPNGRSYNPYDPASGWSSVGANSAADFNSGFAGAAYDYATVDAVYIGDGKKKSRDITGDRYMTARAALFPASINRSVVIAARKLSGSPSCSARLTWEEGK